MNILDIIIAIVLIGILAALIALCWFSVAILCKIGVVAACFTLVTLIL